MNLIAWLTLSIAITSLGTLYYGIIIKKTKRDMNRLLLFLVWVILCVLFPIILLLFSCSSFDKASGTEKLIVFSIWLAPAYIIGFYLNKKGWLLKREVTSRKKEGGTH
jgi:hypothetical protein